MAAASGGSLTGQQRRAVTARGVSVALSAGAGCGKTFVLTERFLSQLAPGHWPAGERPRLSEVIAITFTERAAREMRKRIRAGCRRRLLEAPEREAEHWLGLIRELDSARISTIHSFCRTLLRSHAVEAGLDPQFEVLEQAQADTLEHELIDDEFRSRLAGGDEAMIELVVEFGLEPLREMVAVLLGRRHQIDWATWQTATPEVLLARWETFWRNVSLPSVLDRIARSPETQTVLEIARHEGPDHPTMRDRCGVLAERLAGLRQSGDPSSDLEAIQKNARVRGGGGKGVWPSEATYVRFKGAAECLRRLVDRVRPIVSFDTESACPAAEASLRLLAVAQGVARAYEARKQQLAAVDFDDLLIYARRLLTAPEHGALRRRLASQTRLLLVDEFQDTDPLQDELVEALVGEGLTQGKLFLVGDYKQSIYRFRGADPHVFRRRRAGMPAEGRLPLTLNFRSQPAILDFVNALFCEDLGEQYEPLVASRPQVGPEPAVELLWAPDELPEVRSGQSERIRRREADFIARRLRAMLESGEKRVWDEEAAERGKPAARAVRPGDIALLFRALSDVQYYEEALRSHGIDYYLVGGHAFYAQQEIFDVLNLLRSVASRSDEVSLAGALRSGLFCLEDETLFWLAQHPEGLTGGLFAKDLPRELTAEQRGRVEFAAAVLTELRAVKDRLPVAELIERALARTGYDAVLLAEFLGERKLANLRKLIDRARSLDESGIFSLADFITQLAEFVARQPDEPLAATHPESTDVVRLMTIHQAKGLEFPVAVVPDLDRRTRGLSAAVAFTPELGPAVKSSSGTGGFELHAWREQEEEQAELVRLLYVATTRAADYLILSSGVRRLGSASGPWTELVGRRFDPLSGKLRVELPAGYKSPKVKVTTERPVSPEPSTGAGRRDLNKLVDKAVQLAEQDAGRVPAYLGPVAADRAARRQYSFSRLSGALHPHLADDGAADPLEPGEAASGGPRLDPLGLGTLVHAVLAEIDWHQAVDVAARVRRLAPQHLADDEGGLEEPIEMIGRFLDSPRAAQIAAASRVHRELEFLLAWPPGAVADAAAAPGRYLQGFIDCLYEDGAGRWHVVDYKTNRVSSSTLEKVAAEYEMQMLVYALAVERILGEPPAELVLSFLRPGLEYEIPWGDAARRRAVELVNQRMAAIVEGT